MNRDLDEDGIPIETEGAIDTDGDGIMNYLEKILTTMESLIKKKGGYDKKKWYFRLY